MNYIDYRQLFWCELLQTDVNEEPHNTRCKQKDQGLPIRLRRFHQLGCFTIFKDGQADGNYFEPELSSESRIWVNPCHLKAETKAMHAELGRLGIEEKYRLAITEKIFKAVEVAAPLPKPLMAIDVNIRYVFVAILGFFRGWFARVVDSVVRESWNKLRKMPPVCAICLEEDLVQHLGFFFWPMEKKRGTKRKNQGERQFDDHHDHKLITRLPCLHYFHGPCIGRWLKSSPTCPMCRHEMPINCGSEPCVNLATASI